MSSVEFRLSYLDSSITALTNLAFDSSAANMVVPDAYAFVNVPLATMQNIFKIKNSNDELVPIRFYLDSASFISSIPLNHAKMETSNSSVDSFGSRYNYGTQDISATDNNFFSNDFIRWISTNLFGTPNGADLFTNNNVVISDLESKFYTQYVDILSPLDKSAGSDSGLVSDSDGKYFTESQDGPFNIINTLYQQLLALNRERADAFMALPVGLKSFPFVVGDTVSVYLQVNPFLGQHLVTTKMGATTIAPRKYRIRIVVSDGPTGETVPSGNSGDTGPPE